MRLEEYSRYDALELAELVRRDAVSARELGELALHAIEKLNPHLNAVIEVFADRLPAEDHGPQVGAPFGGVPFLIKDFPMERGRRAEMGSRLAAGYRPSRDSALMTRLRRGGLLALGRTTTSEFGLLASTLSHQTGITRNPWDPARSTAGSSGGSAAAVAAGIVPIASAGDGGGSIRNPASFCGLVGLKPTRGRISLGPGGGGSYSGMVTGFVLTRSVRDCAAALDVTAGYELGDPFEIAGNETGFLPAIGRSQGPLRIAFTTRAWSGLSVDPQIVSSVLETARRLEQHGHILVEESPQFDYQPFLEAQIDLWAAHTAHAIDTIAAATGRIPSEQTLEPVTLALYARGRALSATAFLKAEEEYAALTHRVAEFFVSHDLLLTPTNVITPPLLDTRVLTLATADVRDLFEHLAPIETFTALFNATGQPAISLPLHSTSTGLPIGMQFIGRQGDEATLLRLAARLEEDLPWASRLPLLHASRIESVPASGLSARQAPEP